MSELEQTAEESLKIALAAWDRGDLAAQNEVQKWMITLDNIRRRKASVLRTSTGHSAFESETDGNVT